MHAIKVIGGGRVGKICEAVVKYNASSQETRGMLLPPLIAKVSRPWKTDALAREGFYYEELEYLQGSVAHLSVKRLRHYWVGRKRRCIDMIDKSELG